MTTELWLVRHGDAVHHHTSQLPWPEVPLSEEGHRQARALAARFRQVEELAGVFSSPHRRARETAQPIAEVLRLSVVLDEALREMDFGAAGGLTIEEFRDRWPDLYPVWEDRSRIDFRWPGGESRVEFAERAVRAVETLALAYAGQRIVIVAHTGILCGYLAHLFLGSARRWREFLLRPASVTCVQVGADGARFLLRDDVSHLEAGGPDD
ncbi:MAG: histidine phosphatase family protein [Chloroflexia bacterium]